MSSGSYSLIQNKNNSRDFKDKCLKTKLPTIEIKKYASLKKQRLKKAKT